MSRILVVTQPEYGHCLPLIPILETLHQRGHDIIALTSQEIGQLFERSGFMVDYWMQSSNYFYPNPPRSGYSFWYQFTRRSQMSFRSAIVRRIEEASRLHQPDYYLIDSLFTLKFGIDSTRPPFRGLVTAMGITLPEWEQEIPRIESPLLFLCPPEFEVPTFLIRHPLVRYVEPSCSQTFEAQVPDDGHRKPVVLAAFGTQASMQMHFLEKINAICAVASNHRDLDFIIGAGESHLKVICDLGGKIPENVMLNSYIPQRSLLKRALAFISHGGLSSIKEAIMLGVPMIITPEVADQPFNAMRGVYHGISSAIFADEMNMESLECHLGGILNKSINQGRIQWIQEVFLDAFANPKAADLIEEQIR